MTYTGQSRILGQGTTSAAAIQAWFTARGPGYAPQYAPDGRYAAPPPGLGQAIVDECRRYPQHVVNHDLVAAQILHETAAWQSRYARERNNPGGIGAVNDNPDNAHWFATVAAGVRAHVAHLLVYAAGDGPWSGDTPRRDAVAARGWVGIARAWSDLNGRWAWPGATYGQGIAALANDLVTFAEHESWEPGMGVLSGLVDIRAELPTATGANRGPYDRIPMSQKRGVVIHYNGPPVDPRRDTREFLRAIAQYHVDRNWASPGQPPIYGTGLMYHVAIGRDGTKYLCRDLDRVLWHCGAWPQNANTLAVQMCIGGEQRITPAQHQALTELVDDWLAMTGAPRSEVWGHQELQPTSCPGTIMADWVYPYRAGALDGGDGDREDGPAMSDGRWFSETGHYVGGGFWQFWKERGGVPVFGYPLTEEIIENGRTVQYFERAVFEYHPENDPPYDVLLRRVGAEALGRKGSA